MSRAPTPSAASASRAHRTDALPRHPLSGPGRRFRSLAQHTGAPHVGGTAEDVGAFRSMLRECIVELDTVPIGTTGTDTTEYTGWTYQLDLGPLSVTDVGSDPVRVVRSRRAINRGQDDFYLLSVAQHPSWVAYQDRTSFLETGDAVLLDCTDTYWLSSHTFGHHLVVNVPRADLRRSMRVDRALPGNRIPADNPMLRVLMATVSGIWGNAHSLPPGALPELGHTASELLVSLLRAEQNGGPTLADPKLGRAAQLLRMQDFVRHHLSEPSLSTRTLASAFDVSPRYVEIVFREGGVSPSRYIRETRLARARRLLADPRQLHRSIASVGRSVGIDNASVFARTFRNHFQMTPRDYRQSRAESERADRAGIDHPPPAAGF